MGFREINIPDFECGNSSLCRNQDHDSVTTPLQPRSENLHQRRPSATEPPHAIWTASTTYCCRRHRHRLQSRNRSSSAFRSKRQEQRSRLASPITAVVDIHNNHHDADVLIQSPRNGPLPTNFLQKNKEQGKICDFFFTKTLQI